MLRVLLQMELLTTLVFLRCVSVCKGLRSVFQGVEDGGCRLWILREILQHTGTNSSFQFQTVISMWSCIKLALWCVTKYHKFSDLHNMKLSYTVSMIRMIRNLALGSIRWKSKCWLVDILQRERSFCKLPPHPSTVLGFLSFCFWPGMQLRDTGHAKPMWGPRFYPEQDKHESLHLCRITRSWYFYPMYFHIHSPVRGRRP